MAFRMAIVISAIPVAVNARIAPTLYDLDEDLANSCGIFTIGRMIVVVPALGLLLT